MRAKQRRVFCRVCVRTFGMRTRVTMTHVHSYGGRIEAESGVKALETLLQAGVGTQEVL